MKVEGLKKITVLFLFFTFLWTISSCNRGIGCPSDFSVKPLVTYVEIPW